MFDIGFSELLFLAVVGLLVLGPDRLPEAARTLGLILGRLRRSYDSVRSEISRELEAEEIRQRLQKEREQMGLDELRQSFEKASQQIHETVTPSVPDQESAPEAGNGKNAASPDARKREQSL